MIARLLLSASAIAVVLAGLIATVVRAATP